MWCFLGAKKGGPTPPPLSLKPVAPSSHRRADYGYASGGYRGFRIRPRFSLSLSVVLIIFSLRSVACFVLFLWFFFFLIFLRRDVWFLSRSDTGDASEFDVYGFWFGHQGMIFIDFCIYFFVWWFVCLLWGWSVGWWCWGFDCCVPVLIWDFLIWLCV